jgi:outer membrane protein assembly factor BamB
MPGTRRALAVATVLCAALPIASASAAQEAVARVDWPQFRGLNRDGVSPEVGLLEQWPEGGPPELWRVPLGRGFSAISIVGEHAFTLYGRDGATWLVALDVADGSKVWETRIDEMYRNGQGDGPRATPTVDGDRIYALSGRGNFLAADRHTGSVLWSHRLVEEFGGRAPTWGYSGSPLVEDDTVLIEVGAPGAGVIAFDRATGAEAWRALDTGTGYAAPITIAVGGLRQTVFFTADGVVAIDPTDGAPLWRVPWQTSYDVHAATPVFVPPDRLFIASGYGVGSAMLQIRSDGERARADRLWNSRELENQFSSTVLYGGYLYGFDNSIFMCVDARTGERTWRTRGFGHGSLILADARLLVLSDRGSLALVRPTPAEYVEVSRFQALDGRAWTMPTLANGILYLRNEREAVAFDLRDPGAAADLH